MDFVREEGGEGREEGRGRENENTERYISNCVICTL